MKKKEENKKQTKKNRKNKEEEEEETYNKTKLQMLGSSVFERALQEMSKLRWETTRINRHVNIFIAIAIEKIRKFIKTCLLYTSPSPRDRQKSRMPSSA